MKDLLFTINFSPTEKNLKEIFSWTTFSESNWPEIEKSFKNKNLCVAMLENETVGFFAYKLEPFCVNICIAETKEIQKNKGIARFIKEEIEKKFKNSEFKSMRLYCQPKCTCFFWKRLGFEYYHKNINVNGQIYMFLIFGDVAQPFLTTNTMNRSDNIIEIWDSQYTNNERSTWFMNLEFKNDQKTLVKPILFFGNDKWKIRVVKDGKIFEGSYKNLDRQNDVFEFYYIEEIKL